MAVITYAPFTNLSDIVLNEQEGYIAFNRENIVLKETLADDSTPVTKVKAGTVVFRLKGAATNKTPFAVVETVADLAATNDVAIVIGNAMEFRPEFDLIPSDGTYFNAVALVGGAIQIRDYKVIEMLKEQGVTITFDALQPLLRAQGFKLVETFGA